MYTIRVRVPHPQDLLTASLSPSLSRSLTTAGIGFLATLSDGPIHPPLNKFYNPSGQTLPLEKPGTPPTRMTESPTHKDLDLMIPGYWFLEVLIKCWSQTLRLMAEAHQNHYMM